MVRKQYNYSHQASAKRSHEKELKKVLQALIPSDEKAPQTSSSQSFSAQHLSTPLLPLIGREQEVKAICELLQQSDVRLLTLAGPGGVGKTRLALEIPAEVSSTFVDGTCSVSLALIRAATLVLPTIAQALGLNGRRNDNSLAQIQGAIQDKSFLLLLDNFEHVAEAAPLLKELLAACPNLKILVTSRIVLRLLEERVFYVTPLALPDLANLPTSCEDLSHIAAVTLFLQRARAASPDFALTKDNAYAVAQICVRLDGLPLALELAAARLKLFSPQGLLMRLGNPLSVLTWGVRDAPERQQTLRKTLEWSYRLLTLEEQRLFRRLSVFVGGCSLQAIEAISEATDTRDESLLDAVASLLSQSLLQRESQASREEQRFIMLETIREYALECLQNSEEEHIVRQAHARYYLMLSKKAELQASRGEAQIWLAWIESEFENLRTAFDWFILTRDAERALEMSVTLRPFWVKDTIVEGHCWIERALECCERSITEVQIETRAQAIYTIAMLGCYQRNWAKVDVFANEALHLFRLVNHPFGIAKVLLIQGMGALLRGQHTVAEAAASESIRVLKGTQYPWFSAEAYLVQAYSLYFQGDYRQAHILGKKGLKLSLQAGELYTIIKAIHARALFAEAQGETVDVQAMYEEAMTITQAAIQTGALSPIAVCLIGMGAIVALQKHYTWAASLWGKAKALYKRRDGICEFKSKPYEWLVTILDSHLLYAQVIETVHTQLGEQAFTEAWNKGKDMSLEQLLAEPEPHTISTKISVPANIAITCPNGLTPREREVLSLLAQGLSSASIAEKLVISLTTVNSHIRAIYNKLDVSSRSAATRYAIEHHLV